MKPSIFCDDLEKVQQEKFKIVGIVYNEHYQKCKQAVLKLHRSFPKIYPSPEIRPMLDVEWEDELIKMKRLHGKNFWKLKVPVMVFLNGEFLGDDKDLMKHISEKYRYMPSQDLRCLCMRDLVSYLRDRIDCYRQLAYFMVEINGKGAGTLLFQLYNDLVPITCKNFMDRCTGTIPGYENTPIHRIVKNSWIECGGFDLEEVKMCCENYTVPHDRRGVLCMLNDGRHIKNSTQCFITLAPTPWMDYKYVAFGQLIQGAKLLRMIENVPTFWERPLVPITIVKSGEFSVVEEPYKNDDKMFSNFLDEYMRTGPTTAGLEDEYMKKYSKLGPYKGSCTKTNRLWTDMTSHLPFLHLPSYLLTYLKYVEDTMVENDTNFSHVRRTIQVPAPAPILSDDKIGAHYSNVDKEVDYLDFNQKYKTDSCHSLMTVLSGFYNEPFRGKLH